MKTFAPPSASPAVLLLAALLAPASLDGVAIRGGYAGVGANPDARDFGLYPTVLSGDLLKNDALALVPGQPYPDPLFRTDNSHHVVTIPSTAGSTALLEGVTIRSGHADGTAVLDRRGGGLLALAGSAPTIRDCVFLDNGVSGSSSGGGAIHLVGSQASLERCRFEGNWVKANGGHGARGGAVLSTGATLATFERCRFRGNLTVSSQVQSGGAGLYVEESAPLLRDCLFLGNVSSQSGGAVVVASSGPQAPATPRFEQCVFSGNRAVAKDGGALWVTGPSATDVRVVQCTISENEAPAGKGGGAFVDALALVTLENVVFGWNADALGQGAVHAEPGAGLVSIFSQTFSTPALARAQFRDPDGADGVAGTLDDDLQLASTSSAIDAGKNACLPSGLGLDGNGAARVVDAPDVQDSGVPLVLGGPVVDLGAYEFHGGFAVLPLTATPGEPIVISFAGGPPSQPLGLFVVAVNGSPTHVPVLFASLDAGGSFSIVVDAPAVFPGVSIGLQLCHGTPSGAVHCSDVRTLEL